MRGIPTERGDLHDRPMHARAKTPIKQGGGAHDDSGADDLQGRLDGIGAQKKNRQGRKRGDAATGENAVVNLQHVKRANEQQQVHGARKNDHAPDGLAAILESTCEDGMRPG